MTGNAGELVLRLAVGVLILLHGFAQIFSGVNGITGMPQGMFLFAGVALALIGSGRYAVHRS